MDETSPTALTVSMATAANAWLESLDVEQRGRAIVPFEESDRRHFSYLPGPRPGLALVDMTEQQRMLAMRLLATGLSESGTAAARAVMALDDTLRSIEEENARAGAERRNSLHYWFRIYGEPARGSSEMPWAWEVGGHHLTVHTTIVDDRISGTPQFFGANPATTPAGYAGAGQRTLPAEEDLARAFLDALTPSQREMAISGFIAPRDIRTRNDPVADPNRIAHGLAYHHMHGEHRDLLVRLIRHYLDRGERSVAESTWAEIEAAGLDNVTFRWAGSTERGVGHGHYYAVLGPTFLLEYDNTQDDANHVHTVWRDLRHDWGSDLLAAHYADGRH